MSSQPVVHVGVVLYRNSPEELERLFVALDANARERGAPAQRVSFLDNSPTDGLRAVVAAAGHGLRYQHSDENLGFGRGHNVLMSEAFAATPARAYVCVNPDSVPHPRCVIELIAEMERRTRSGLVEAMQFPDEHPKRYDPDTHATPWCSGCILLITRELYEAVGGFDDRFFMYCEDVDLSWRARAAGFSTSIAPEALAYHWVFDRRSNSSMALQMYRSAVLLAAKYGSAPFMERYLQQYLQLGGAPFPLPEVDRPQPAVTDFDHLLHFAEARW